MRKLTVAAVGLTTLGALVGAPAHADPGTATHIDSLTATVGASTIQVSGAATFVDAPKLVGQDGADAAVPGIGADIRDITISRVPPKGAVKFTLSIADQPPTIFGIPETVAYLWDITVKTGTSESSYELWAARTAQNASFGGTDPVFRRYICTPNPTPPPDVNCGSAVTVPGRMQDGVVEWQVPANQISASPGSVITSSAIEVNPTASGVIWGGLRLDLGGAAQDEEYVVPGPTVQLGIAPAGTPAAQVPLATAGVVNTTTSAFTGSVAKPSQAGEYVLVAQACFGAGSCGERSSTAVTV
jgi:hypothetical protein